MRKSSLIFVLALFLSAAGANQNADSAPPLAKQTYLGFDRNEYPGDDNLGALRQTFSFVGYWLNVPPGGTRNTWVGKREVIRRAGFGFLILFNGRLYAELKKSGNAAELGKSDGAAAVASAKQEGFPARAVVFLDVEEGGRMLPEQKSYIYAWVDAITAEGYRAGVYCSGIAASEGHGVSVITADDIRQNAGARELVFWVTNDGCPPSPGCAVRKPAPVPSASGIDYADVWQFAQSPKRKAVARGCPANYSRDRNCYPPGTAKTKGLFVDLDASLSEDPSSGR